MAVFERQACGAGRPGHDVDEAAEALRLTVRPLYELIARVGYGHVKQGRRPDGARCQRCPSTSTRWVVRHDSSFRRGRQAALGSAAGPERYMRSGRWASK